MVRPSSVEGHIVTHKIDNTHKRGFASMDKARLREIASMGGKKAHALGRAHQWTQEEAAEAGKIGGSRNSENRRLQRG